MSVRGTQITEADLKAPAGMFRLALTSNDAVAGGGQAKHFLVDDYPEKWAAIDQWQRLRRTNKKQTVAFVIYDDTGTAVIPPE